jgi:hypothetical protein
MSLSDRTYVIFDGDKDLWAYGYMKGWKENERVDFDFVDAHDLEPLTARAENEGYIKQRLRERLRKSKQVIVLVGESTKDLYKFVRWEIQLALELASPIIIVTSTTSAITIGRFARRFSTKSMPSISLSSWRSSSTL